MANPWLRNRPPVLALLFLIIVFAVVWRETDVPLGPNLSWTFDSSQESKNSPIPSILHFVQLKKDDNSELRLSFEAFLALYAANRFIRPSTIYIHTDFSPQDVAAAIEHGSSWTRKVLTSFPEIVHVNYVTAPTEANGLAIKRVEHRSDFVRLEQLAKFGGIYLDWDVITLRPLAPLLNAGFRTVVGRQYDGFINNGIYFATKDSGVVDVMRRETPRVFDGGWITHSVALLTKVSNRLAIVPGEVLILDFKAFSPFEWSQESANKELQRHVGDAVPEDFIVGYYDVSADATTAWNAKSGGKKKDWEYDFSDAYFLHKFYNDVDAPRGYEGVSVPYILARDSNYALATWPIVMQGIRDGLIDSEDGSL